MKVQTKYGRAIPYEITIQYEIEIQYVIVMKVYVSNPRME